MRSCAPCSVSPTLVVSLSFSSSSSLAKQAESANALSKDADQAYQQWLVDDGQSDMYVGVLALHEPSQQALAESAYQQAAAAFQATEKAMADATALATHSVEHALLTRMGTDLATYNDFTQQMRQDVSTANWTAR